MPKLIHLEVKRIFDKLDNFASLLLSADLAVVSADCLSGQSAVSRLPSQVPVDGRSPVKIRHSKIGSNIFQSISAIQYDFTPQNL